MSVGNELAAELGNDRDAMLNALFERLGTRAYLRGNELTLDGDDGAVERARLVVDELAELVAEGVSVGAQTVDAVAGVLTEDGRAVDVLHDIVWMHRGNKVTPKTIVQKRYVDAIRANTVTFGIGPAGTGKTYLAMALAVAALQEREVARIILTRPAVEAGERLGFLPGDLLEKVTRTCVRSSTPCTTCSTPNGCSVVHGQGDGRGRAARVHARADAERLVHHPRRGPEHDARADADVPDPARLRTPGSWSRAT